MTGRQSGSDISRRGFVAGVAGIFGALVSALIGIPAIGYMISPAMGRSSSVLWVPLGPVEGLVEGQPKLYTFTRTQKIGWEATATSYGAYVIKIGSEYDVFSNVCTHLSCRYSWREDLAHFFCPCHDGHYAKDGAVISGPPPRPLDRFEYKVQEGILSIRVVGDQSF